MVNMIELLMMMVIFCIVILQSGGVCQSKTFSLSEYTFIDVHNCFDFWFSWPMVVLLRMMVIFCICLIMVTLVFCNMTMSYSAMTKQQSGDDLAKKREWSKLPHFQSESFCQKISSSEYIFYTYKYTLTYMWYYTSIIIYVRRTYSGNALPNQTGKSLLMTYVMNVVYLKCTWHAIHVIYHISYVIYLKCLLKQIQYPSLLLQKD